MDEQAHKVIAAYADSSGSNDSVMSEVYYLNPGTYGYLFASTPGAIRFLSRRFDGGRPLRTIAALIFDMFAVRPEVVRFFPGVQRVEIPTNPELNFDVCIIGTRIKLLDLDGRTVTTLALKGPDDVLAELQTRRQLPSTINVPQILEADESFPYYIEEMITGRELRDPVDEWRHVRCALEQLEDAYKTFTHDWIKVDALLDSIHRDLVARGLFSDSVVNDLFQLVSASQLPNRVAMGFAHGDLFTGNILLGDDESVYIIDWADAGDSRLLCTDFIHAFAKYYADTGDPAIIHEFVDETGRGGKILSEYASRLGETVYDEQNVYGSIVLLYPLVELAAGRYQRDYDETVFYKLAKEIVVHMQ